MKRTLGLLCLLSVISFGACTTEQPAANTNTAPNNGVVQTNANVNSNLNANTAPANVGVVTNNNGNQNTAGVTYINGNDNSQKGKRKSGKP